MEKYRKQFYNDHKTGLYDKSIICELCGGKYRYSNKTHHMQSKKHKNLQDYNETKHELEVLRNKIKDLIQ